MLNVSLCSIDSFISSLPRLRLCPPCFGKQKLSSCQRRGTRLAKFGDRVPEAERKIRGENGYRHKPIICTKSTAFREREAEKARLGAKWGFWVAVWPPFLPEATTGEGLPILALLWYLAVSSENRERKFATSYTGGGNITGRGPRTGLEPAGRFTVGRSSSPSQ